MELPQLDYLPTVPVALRRGAELHGDRDFVVMPDRRLSFRQAEAASRRVAKQLIAAGIGKGSRVAIHYANSPEWIVAFFAVTRIGAIGIPLSTAYKPAELRKALRHSDAQAFIFPPTLAGVDHLSYVEQALPSLAGWKEGNGLMLLPEAPFLRTIFVSGDTDRAWGRQISLAADADADDFGISDAHLEAMEAEVAPADWVMLVYTSGTTADPKGVIHTHGNWIRHNDNLSKFLGVTSETKTYGGMPWFWIGGLGLGVGNALCRGFALVCVEKFDPAVVLELIQREKPVAIGMWPQLAQRFREYIVSTGIDVNTVPGFMPPPGGPVDPGLKHNSLGQTESFGPHTGAPGSGPEAGRILPEELRGSFGLRVPYIEHKIVDPDTNEELPEGVDGELKVRGYSIAHGLYKKERYEAFDDDGWLHTGDKCHFRGPYLFFKGRISEMIKTSGSNVAPREVELTLETFPEIALAVVLGIPDERRGEAVGVVLVPPPGVDIDIASVRARAYEELSNYKVPSRYLVLQDHELPILGNGKPDKLKLRQLLADVPDQHH